MHWAVRTHEQVQRPFGNSRFPEGRFAVGLLPATASSSPIRTVEGVRRASATTRRRWRIQRSGTMRVLTQVAAIVALLASILGGCATTETAYERARRFDTVAAYEAYLKDNPSGPEAASAKTRVAELEDETAFRTTEHQNIPVAYREFATRQPTSKYAAEATRRTTGSDEDALVWTVGIGSKSAYEGFAKSYPLSEYLSEVQDRIRWMDTAKLGFAVEGMSEKDILAAFGSTGPDPRLVLLPYGVPVEGKNVSVVIEARFARSVSKTPRFPEYAATGNHPACRWLLAFVPLYLPLLPAAATCAVIVSSSTTTTYENWETTIRLGDLGQGAAYVREAASGGMTAALPGSRYAAYVEEADFIVWLVNSSVSPEGIGRAALKHSDSYFRLAVVRTLGIRQPALVALLITALFDEQHDVREAAAEILGRTRDPRAVEPLISILASSHGANAQRIRQKAAETLGALGDPRAFDPLVHALKDEVTDVRASAAIGLGQLGDRRAIEPLIARLTDEWPNVYYNAARALERITGQTYGVDRTRWQAWWEQNKDKTP
jgi:hypothetical protein